MARAPRAGHACVWTTHLDPLPMTARLPLAMALALGLLAHTAAAQTGEDVLRYTQRTPAAGARMTGMAGAAVAGVPDWGAAFANPAGLGYVGRSHATGALGATIVQSDVRSGGHGDARASQVGLGSSAYVAKIPTVQGALVLGVGYHEVASFERELFFSGPDIRFGFEEQLGEVFEEGRSGELSVAGAVEVAPGVMTGLSANAVVGTYTYAGYFDRLSAQQTAYVDEFLEADLRGVNLRAGLTAEVVPGVRLGTVLETPTILRVSETYDFGSDFGSFDYTVTTPWRAAAGAAYEAAGWLLAADIEFLDGSQARLRPSRTFADENLDIRRHYREAINTRFGAEYDFGLAIVRAGAAFQPDPLRDELRADRLRSTYSVGLGLRAGPDAVIDVAYAYTQFRDQLFTPFEMPILVEEAVARHTVLLGLRVDL